MPIQISQKTKVEDLKKKVFSEFWKAFPEVYKEKLHRSSEVAQHGSYEQIHLTRVHEKEGMQEFVPLTTDEQIRDLWADAHNKGEVHATFDASSRGL